MPYNFTSLYLLPGLAASSTWAGCQQDNFKELFPTPSTTNFTLNVHHRYSNKTEITLSCLKYLFLMQNYYKKLCLNRKRLQDKCKFQLYQESVFNLVIKSKGVIKSKRRVLEFTWIQHGIRRTMYSGAIHYLKAASGKITTNMMLCQNGKWLTETGV